MAPPSWSAELAEKVLLVTVIAPQVSGCLWLELQRCHLRFPDDPTIRRPAGQGYQANHTSAEFLTKLLLTIDAKFTPEE